MVPKSFFGLDTIKNITVRRNIPPPPYEFDADDDSVFRFEKYTGEAILKGIADTVKNLNIKTDAQTYNCLLCCDRSLTPGRSLALSAAW